MLYLRLIIITGLLATLIGCTDFDPSADTTDRNIMLGVALGDIDVNSRATAHPFLGQFPTKERPLETALWFATEDCSYEHNPTGESNLPVHTKMTFEGTQMEYAFYDNKNIQYPGESEPVYCIGLYPDDNLWNPSDNFSTVSHQIDGSTDLMFARPIMGTWKNRFGKLKYEHALTWIKIAVCAVSNNALEAWGDLEYIYICSKSGVEIKLDMDVATVPNTTLEDRYFYTDDEIWIETLNLEDPLPITPTMDEIGSVFCSPETEYKLRIKTTNNEKEVERTVSLNWLTTDDVVTDVKIRERARGRCFIIQLYFWPYNVLSASCTLDKWNLENDDIYLD